MKRKILIIDDKLTIGTGCKRVLENENYSVEHRQNGKSGLKEALTGEYDLILLDLLLPDIEGMEILRIIRSKDIQSEVVIITGYATIQTAVEAIKLGAANYISKPFSPDELIINVNKVLQHKDIRQENIALRKELGLQDEFKGIIGESEVMKKVFSLIKRVAPTECNILITGESGTGKEVVAQAIHRISPRKDQPFIACDCSALTPTLLESELFGHAKGSYSGAISTKQGLFEIADKGTLFLDEVSNISLEIQSKLLRVLETRKIRRVGDTVERTIDIRLISASNRNLTEMVEEGNFRDDLFYRIEVIPVHLPPLRERHGDIIKLAINFFDNIRRTSKIKARNFSPEAVELLERYTWPGNIRELKNIVERVAILCNAETIQLKHLPREINKIHTTATSRTYDFPSTWEEFKEYRQRVKDDAVMEIEQEFLMAALRKTGGNISMAAKLIGIQRSNLHSLLKKHNINSKAN